MKDPAELEELISIYALGALEGEELEEVERLLASGDPESQELLRKYQDVASHLFYSSSGRMPDPSFRKKVLKEILGAPEKPVVEVSPPFWKRFQLVGFSFGAAVAAMLVLVLFPTNDSFNQQIADQQKTISSLKTTIAQKELEIGELEGQYAKLDELSEFLEDPGVHAIQLANMHTDKDAGGGVLFDQADNEAMFYCLDLEHPPEGKTYQWWVKSDQGHKSIAVFKVDNKGSSVIKVDSVSDFGNIQGYLVTIEPIGGAERPSDKLIFAGDHRGSSL